MNPNWTKGCPPTNPKGRPVGTKNDPMSPKQRKKFWSKMFQDMEDYFGKDGRPGLMAWLMGEIEANPELKKEYIRGMIQHMLVTESAVLQGHLALAGMDRDRDVASLTGSSGPGAGGGVIVNVTDVMAPSEATRRIDRITSEEVKALPEPDDSDVIEMEEADDDSN